VFGIVHDEHAPNVQLDAVAMLAIPQIELRMRRDEQQVRVLLPTLDLGMAPGNRRLEIVRDVLVELLVLLFGDLRSRPRPQGGRLVDLLFLVADHVLGLLLVPFLLAHQDRQRDVVGVLAQDLTQAMP
jgi:hypothetical protein